MRGERQLRTLRAFALALAAIGVLLMLVAPLAVSHQAYAFFCFVLVPIFILGRVAFDSDLSFRWLNVMSFCALLPGLYRFISVPLLQ